jgi:hypothetical protein
METILINSIVVVVVLAGSTTGLSRLVGNAVHKAHADNNPLKRAILQGLLASVIALAALLASFIIGQSAFSELFHPGQSLAIQGLGFLVMLGAGLVVAVPAIKMARPLRA